ncbi:enoyl-CoA hydratase/isomerase family protein [Chloroflexota bacterium]
MSKYEEILLEKEDGIAILTLNRPAKLNSLNRSIRVEMIEAFEEIELDDSVRVMILTGAGRAFCAGLDITPGAYTFIDKLEPGPVDSAWQISSHMRNLTKPSICAWNGVAGGLGGVYALTCDIIIASEQASYLVGFTQLGLLPECGLHYLLPQRVGSHRAFELLYTSDLIDAKEMDRIGLVNRVVPHDELMKTAKELAKRIMRIPPYTLALVKQQVYRGIDLPDLESEMQYCKILGNNRTEESIESMAEARKAFAEKREPVYKPQYTGGVSLRGLSQPVQKQSGG